MRSPSSATTGRGFSLLSLAIWMIGLGLVIVVVLALLPSAEERRRVEQTVAVLGDAQDALLSFVVENSRLPAPDTDGDGLENAGSTTGALPYRSMGLPTRAVDQVSVPLRYTPFVNAPVDLTVASSSYAPALPDLSTLSTPGFAPPLDPGVLLLLGPIGAAVSAITTPPAPTLDLCASRISASPMNLLDFCTDLEAAIGATATPVSTAVNVGPSPNENVAYAVLSGGLEDADGNGLDGSLDGLNDDGDVVYEDPARGRGFGYDDIVRATRFSTLQRELSCRPLLDSVNLLAGVAESGKGVLEGALSSWGGAEAQVVMASVAILMDVIAIAQTIQAGIGIAADIGKASGGCASVVLSAVCCPALAANIAGAVVYAVTGVVQLAAMAANTFALVDSIVNRNLFRSDIVPRANDNLCDAIEEVVNADARGGLAGKTIP